MTCLGASAKALLLILVLGSVATLDAQSDKPQAGTYSLLYSFHCGPDGANPQAGLVRDSSGNLYGTTNSGGQYDYGTVFEMTPDGIEIQLHSFEGPPAGGANAFYGGLTLDTAGNVYGTAEYGGSYYYGTVFKVTPTHQFSVLYSFTGGSDGGYPYGGMARDSDGNLYGTAIDGGAYGYGVVFKLTIRGTENVLHSFEYSSTDGAYPASNITLDPSGNLYGTTEEGGASGLGTVFEVTASGTESELHSFKGGLTDGSGPYGGGLLRDPSGSLYGVTEGGGKGYGVVFKLTPEGTEGVLHEFNGTTDGQVPIDGLAMDAAGNLYGTTQTGGTGTGCGGSRCGVLFELTTTGKEIVLHDFNGSSSRDGSFPYGGVVRDSSGNLYGTLSTGGAYGCGAVFKYTP